MYAVYKPFAFINKALLGIDGDFFKALTSASSGYCLEASPPPSPSSCNELVPQCAVVCIQENDSHNQSEDSIHSINIC